MSSSSRKELSNDLLPCAEDLETIETNVRKTRDLLGIIEPTSLTEDESREAVDRFVNQSLEDFARTLGCAFGHNDDLDAAGALVESGGPLDDGFSADDDWGSRETGLSFNPKKVYIDHSYMLKPFSTKSTTFTYTPDGRLEKEFSGRQLEEFIYDRPPERLLTVWIQRCPHGVGNRFASRTVPQCMCSECPLVRLRDHGLPTNRITRGEYMVAFDELEQYRAGQNIDPYAVSGHIHFYCLERFVGLGRLALHIGGSEDNFHVPYKLDKRTDMPHEPKGHWGCTLSKNDVLILERWRSLAIDAYQPPSDYATSLEFSMPLGCHEKSLLKYLYERRFEEQTENERNRATSHGNEGTQQHVHKGDLEVVAAAKMHSAKLYGRLTHAQHNLLSDARKPWIDAERRRQREAATSGEADQRAKKRQRQV
ncbi:hypothetical protein CAC42_6313 [Sphaceloma murrayae]|uniref:Uncharacterized protein n=1 Tax=Sphaceloma murrayae TaxID=2082308 RepID=A0A2K1QTV4_9PEZI|nr:hypothetical protein CAC42_6313 [Sphaceloma murrayae]